MLPDAAKSPEPRQVCDGSNGKDTFRACSDTAWGASSFFGLVFWAYLYALSVTKSSMYFEYTSGFVLSVANKSAPKYCAQDFLYFTFWAYLYALSVTKSSMYFEYTSFKTWPLSRGRRVLR
jgi:hypothetical protein